MIERDNAEQIEKLRNDEEKVKLVGLSEMEDDHLFKAFTCNMTLERLITV